MGIEIVRYAAMFGKSVNEILSQKRPFWRMRSLGVKTGCPGVPRGKSVLVVFQKMSTLFLAMQVLAVGLHYCLQRFDLLVIIQGVGRMNIETNQVHVGL